MTLQRAVTVAPHTLGFDRLFDDAAIFPPGNAPLETAIGAHLRWRGSPHQRYVGPFVCASTRWDELLDCLPAGAVLPLSLTVPDGVGAVGAAVAAALHEPRTRLVAVEVAAPADETLPEALEVFDFALPRNVAGFVELPAQDVGGAACGRLARSRHRLKVRVGGPSPETFPDDEVLAQVICLATALRLPFKLTAGLHRAIRHRDPMTDFEHHGFLNVLVATAGALEGCGATAARHLLANRDPGRVAGLARGLGLGALRRVRAQFLSFGTCSIGEPLDDLLDLGLIAGLQPR